MEKLSRKVLYEKYFYENFFLDFLNHLFKGVGCINVTDLVVPGIFSHEEIIQNLNQQIIIIFIRFMIIIMIIVFTWDRGGWDLGADAGCFSQRSQAKINKDFDHAQDYGGDASADND